MDFKVDPKLYDTLNDDQKAQLKEALAQHEAVVKKEADKEYQAKVEQEKETLKKTIEQEAEAKSKAEKERDAYLKTIPEHNQKLVTALLDAGKTPDEISKDFSELTKEPEMPAGALDQAINGKPSEDVAKQLADDKAFIDDVKAHGLSAPKDEYDEAGKARWKRYAELKKAGKL